MVWQGIPVSRGIALGPAFVYTAFTPVMGERYLENSVTLEKDTAEELSRFNAAVRVAADELTALQQKMAGEDPGKAGIFEAHEDILTDVAIMDEIIALIGEERYTGEYAVETVFEKFAKIFEEMDDDIMKERCADFRDVKNRVLRIFTGAESSQLSEMSEPSVIFAHDLLPSDTAALNRKMALAIVAEIGGNTSHSAILARGYEIPAILGVNRVLSAVKNGTPVIVDALEGLVIIDPPAAESAEYEAKLAAFKQTEAAVKKYRRVESRMEDGGRVGVCLNIGSVSEEELEGAAFTDGVGLFRSEFLFMSGKDLPGENEQYQTYRKAAETWGSREVILRSLDIGGDKTFESLNLPAEDNPFLGCRALRLCFQRTDVFKTQLRAALRASVHGRLALMFPMVGSIEDLHKAKYYLEECREELDYEKIPYNKNMPVGIMIEIPAIALMAELVVKEADFASIGTNDLCQYLMAVDRLNPNVASYYQSYHPAMFKLIRYVAGIFEREGKPLSICGEMGGDPMAVMAFIGMGIKKFSMAASNVAPVKRMITRLCMNKAREISGGLEKLGTAPEIEDYLKKQFESLFAEETEHVFQTN